ncbi:hypothetical protein ES5_15581 [Dietzia cinnamea P4]|nr:hypothetical protein ES5_15581 [Dietzia cinnamea P4]
MPAGVVTIVCSTPVGIPPTEDWLKSQSEMLRGSAAVPPVGSPHPALDVVVSAVLSIPT